MTSAETEIVANAGVQLREIAERLTIPATATPRGPEAREYVRRMDAAALSISEVYGQLSALPLDNEAEAPAREVCPDCGGPIDGIVSAHSVDCPGVQGLFRQTLDA